MDRKNITEEDLLKLFKNTKNSKQIFNIDNGTDINDNNPNYLQIMAPISYKPRINICEISLLIANYKDPKTNLYYHCQREYDILNSLSNDIINNLKDRYN